jgi:LSD1 subclass zinc finger protein
LPPPEVRRDGPDLPLHLPSGSTAVACYIGCLTIRFTGRSAD